MHQTINLSKLWIKQWNIPITQYLNLEFQNLPLLHHMNQEEISQEIKVNLKKRLKNKIKLSNLKLTRLSIWKKDYENVRSKSLHPCLKDLKNQRFLTKLELISQKHLVLELMILNIVMYRNDLLRLKWLLLWSKYSRCK